MHAAAAAAAVLLLLAVGQPIFTDDLWWHLALGRYFAAEGPWLAADPLLFTATVPPSSSSWLFDATLAKTLAAGGFDALRLLHVTAVAAILTGVWWLLRRASVSVTWAGLGTLCFAALAAYRLVQLRPHLLSMLAALAIFRLLIESRAPPGPGRIAAAAALVALWANLHAGFPLAPAMVGAAALASALASFAQPDGSEERARAFRLGCIAGLLALAGLANPAAAGAYSAWFVAGVESAPLELVLDEWRGVAPWRWPVSTLPPSPLAWGLVWAQGLGVGWVIARALQRRHEAQTVPDPDPAWVGLAVLALALQLVAVRFLWLGVFPLLLVVREAARTWRGRDAFAVAIAAPLLLIGFVVGGDWPMISRRLPAVAEGYARSYAVDKYFAEAVWLLRDAGLGGNLYTDYTLGGFAGYWLAPRVRTLWNGSLNFPTEVLADARAIALRRGRAPDEGFSELLDRLGVDLFLGARPPEVGPPLRPWVSTLAHLEDTPGWVPIFRSLGSALYLRVTSPDDERLQRIAAWYRARGVAFDPARGFDVAAALRSAPDWCVEQSVVPRDFATLEHRVRFGGGDPGPVSDRQRLAALHAVLGLYESAVALDRETLASNPGQVRARRRLVWSLARLGRYAQAREAAAGLAEQPAGDALSRYIAAEVRRLEALDPAEARAVIARLPLLERGEVPWLFAGVASAPLRPPRDGDI